MNTSAEVYRFRFRGIDPNYAFQPYTILLLRESIACRAGISYDMVVLEGINGPEGYRSFTADSTENRFVTPVPIQCAVINNMHWDSRETADPLHVMELMKEPIYEYQLFVPVDNVKRINYMNFLSGAVNEKYADVLAANPHSFYDGQPYPVSNHRPPVVPDEEQHLFSLIVWILFVECALVAGLRYIIRCVRGRGQPYVELSQVVVEPVIVFGQPTKRRSSASAE
jgi:hypothetical protein